MRREHKYTHGWALLDAIIGMTMMAAILTGLIVASSQQRKASRAMAEQRQLARDAELAATQWQLGQEVTVPDVTFEAIDGGWTRVRVERTGQWIELYAPADTRAMP